MIYDIDSTENGFKIFKMMKYRITFVDERKFLMSYQHSQTLNKHPAFDLY